MIKEKEEVRSHFAVAALLNSSMLLEGAIGSSSIDRWAQNISVELHRNFDVPYVGKLS